MSAVLVQTKLRPPRRRRGVVTRHRLDTRLALDRLPPVAVVSAPAGFGKTTLLVEWAARVETAGGRIAWLSLDQGDSDPSVFWSYVAAALGAAQPELGSATPTDAVAALVNELAQGGELALVLDDYHVIESLDVHASVRFLIEHLPPHVHVVIASRADPPWPLAALRARGDLLEIRAADLRFTAAEATAYLNDATGLGLSASDAGTLAARTEGWIAALQLAAISLENRNDQSAFIEQFAGTDRFVVDYLADEVLDRQPDDVRRFLLETSILSRLSADLCAAVTGHPGAASMLDALERSNLFLVALDDSRGWYRYHHLFADVLRARLAAERPAAAAEGHRRASVWWQAHGDDDAAIAHALAGGDVDRAAELIELAAPQLRRRRQEATLRRWLEALPAGVFENRPVLTISLVGARMAVGDTSGVADLLRSVEAVLDDPAAQPIVFDHGEFDALRAQTLVYRAGLALLAGDRDATMAHASAALAQVAPDDHLRRGSAAALLGLAHWFAGDLPAAERRYAEAVEALIAAGYLADSLGCSLALADLQIAQGRLSDAVRTFEAALRLTAARPGLRGAADMHVGLSEVLIERNDLDRAAHHLELSADLGEAAGLPQHAYRWRVTMARLCRARGDLDQALTLIDEAAPLYNTDYSPPVRPVAAIRAHVQLARGDLAAAQASLAERNLAVTDDLPYVTEYEHITLARILIAQHAAGAPAGALAAAENLLDRLRLAAERGNRVGSLIEIEILQAAAYSARGDSGSALAALDAALRRAERERHIRMFLHAGPDVTALLRALAARADAPPHAAVVADALPPTGAVATTRRVGVLVDELSRRELEVLRMLRTELTGPEIARELSVSLNTLRTHTKNIFMKLGATNRRSAVRRADELGL